MGGSRDTIETYGNSVKVDGGAGDDSIKTTGGSGVTLHGGAGNDTLTGSSNGEVFQFRSDGGEDVITNFDANDTLYITAGNYDGFSVDGDDLIINAKGAKYSGSIRLLDAALLPVKYKVGNGAVETIETSTVNVIDNRTRNVIVLGSDGIDSVYNYAKNVTIQAGNGDDTVETYGNSVSVFGGKGNDSIKTTGGSGVTLHGGEGNDSLTGSSNGEVFQFRSDGGEDVITNFDANDTLHIAVGALETYYADGDDVIIGAKGAKYSGSIRLIGAAGNPVKVKVGNGAVQTVQAESTPPTPTVPSTGTVFNETPNTVLTGSSDGDVIHNFASNVTINGLAGNDTLTSYGDKILIDGGAGADVVVMNFGGSNATLHGGAGNDTLSGSNGGEVFQFRSDGGEDIITNFDVNDTLHITAGSFNGSSVDGNDLIINAKGAKYSGSIRLLNAASIPVKYKVANGAVETIEPETTPAVPSTGTIFNETPNTVLTGSSDGDVIHNFASNVTINGLAGNDTLTSFGDNVTIDGGAGADVVMNSGGSNTTLHGGAGNDTLSGSSDGEVFQFRSDGGNDVITNFDANDTLNIAAGSLDTYYSSGSDLVIKVKGANYSGAITLQGAALTPIKALTPSGLITINDVSSNTIFNANREKVVTGTSDADSVYNYAKNVTLNGGAGDDTIITYGNSVMVGGGDGADWIENIGGAGGTLDGGNGDDTLTGSSGGDIFRFGLGVGSDVITNFGKNDTLNITSGSLATYYADENDVIVSVTSDDQSGVLRLQNAAYTQITVLDAAGDVIGLPVLSYIVTLDSSVGDAFNLEAYNATVETKAVHIDAGAVDHSLRIYGDGQNNSIRSGNSDMTSVVYTVDGGEGNDTMYGGDRTDIFYYESADGNDVIYNFDDNDIVRLDEKWLANVSFDGNDVILNLTTGNHITLKGAIDKQIDINEWGNRNLCDYTFGRVSITGDTLKVNSDYVGDNIEMELYAAKPKVLDASGYDKSLRIYGTGSKDVIHSGNSDYASVSYTVDGGVGNDTMYGGDRTDIFFYDSVDGNDVIYNFDDNDIVRFYETNLLNSVSLSGDDVILNLTTGNHITLKGAIDKQIDINHNKQWNDDLYDYTFGRVSITGDTLKVNEDYVGGAIEMELYAANPKVLDASGYDKSLRIYGTGSKDVIYSGNSDYTAVVYTVDGGVGNDTMYGGDRTDVFYYESVDGNDVIYNFDDNDIVRFYETNLLNSVSLSGDDVILNLTTGNHITLKGAIDKQIDINHNKQWNDDLYDYTFGRVSITGDTLKVNSDYVGGDIRMELYAANPKVLDASGYDKSIRIYGTGSKDVIHSGNSDYTSAVYTVDGGGGNDTMYGGDRTDVFYYESGDGNDVIVDFTENDRIHFQNSDAKLDNISYDDNDVILNLTSGNTITLKDAKGITVNITGQSSGSYSTETEAQMPSDDDYWFDQPTVEESPLDQIIQSDHAVDLSTEFTSDIFNRAALDRITFARHERKK